jgi:hypothetical protein
VIIQPAETADGKSEYFLSGQRFAGWVKKVIHPTSENFHNDCLTIPAECRHVHRGNLHKAFRYPGCHSCRMSLQTRELSGVMLLGLSDTAYAFACKFGTIRLHSLQASASPFLASAGLYFPEGAFSAVSVHANCRQMAASPVFLKLPTFHSGGGPVNSLHRFC